MDPAFVGGVLSQMRVRAAGQMGSGAAGQYLVSRGRSYKTSRSKLPDCPTDDCPADVGGVTEWLMVADCKSAGLCPT
jgi:hypothetical protein